MKRLAVVIFLLLGILFILSVPRSYAYFDGHRGLWGVLKIMIPLALAAFGCISLKMSAIFFKEWQFDVQLKELIDDYHKAEPGSLTLKCSSQYLADEFWRLYKDAEPGRIYDRQSYDSQAKLLRFKKRY